MREVSLREINRDNWRAALALSVQHEQQKFISDYTPIAAIVLAKSFIRPDGLNWTPYAIYADTEMVGLFALACNAASRDDYLLYHFFIDQKYQGQSLGKAALQEFVRMVRTNYPACEQIRLTVHPENYRAQKLYRDVGF